MFNRTVFFTCLFISLIVLESDNMPANAANVYDFKVQTIDGQEKSLADFKGQAILIVNTASKCGYTPQYKSLESLYEKYKDKGLTVLGFPANNFMFQEPGTNAEIKNFCFLNYKVSFPMFSKISVSGPDMAPLYKYLTAESGRNGPIKWNFTKFLVASDGNVIARYEPKTDPLNPEVVAKIEESLPQ